MAGLFERQNDSEGAETETRSFICWFISQMTTVAEPRRGLSQGPGTPSGSPIWWAGSQL